MNIAAHAVWMALIFSTLAIGQNGCPPQRVLSPSEIATDDFGSTVATNGNQWFVSAPDARTLCAGSALACSTGAVFVYEKAGDRLVHAQTIAPPDVALYDKFGFSFDVDGNRMAVGSLSTRNPVSGLRTGAIFVYEYDGVEWVEVDRIWPPAQVTQEFAASIELDGPTLIVHELVPDRFWVYGDSSGSFELLQEVLPPEPLAPLSAFGYHWAVKDEWFVTSAYLDRRVWPTGGSVFVYRRLPDGTLDLVQELLSEPQWMYLGIAMAFAGDTLAVGAPLATRDYLVQGVVRLYEFDGEGWALDDELLQDDPGENHRFGYRLIAQNDRLYVTAENELTPSSRGMVYAFERDADGSWIQAGRLVPEPVRYADHYGWDLASDRDHLLVAARGDLSPLGVAVGAAYFFDLECEICISDLDLDGVLTIFDFLLFSNLFQDGDAQADLDGDGELTLLDFLAFQTAFDAGC